MADAKISRQALQSALNSTRLSIRNLSRRVGLKNHAPLAQYLSGKKKISMPLLRRRRTPVMGAVRSG